MTDREKHIKNLSYIMDSMPDDACGDWRDSLAYAISSLKTDEAYQLMYEGEEVYTKADMVDMLRFLWDEVEDLDKADMLAMLEELKAEIEELPSNHSLINGLYEGGYKFGLKEVNELVQERIDTLRGGKNE